MVKSSEVLRLAAELEFGGDVPARSNAFWIMKASAADRKRQGKYLNMVRWIPTPPCSEHAVMALCLAAAIAESEGD